MYGPGFVVDLLVDVVVGAFLRTVVLTHRSASLQVLAGPFVLVGLDVARVELVVGTVAVQLVGPGLVDGALLVQLPA